ncbi:MAG: hypothetical protein J5791_03165 [Fibrobacter sp.]|nr:hypothetical protein [Fibrobacter sp.]
MSISIQKDKWRAVVERLDKEKDQFPDDELRAYENLSTFYQKKTYDPKRCADLCLKLENSPNNAAIFSDFVKQCKKYYTNGEPVYRRFQKALGGWALSLAECEQMEQASIRLLQMQDQERREDKKAESRLQREQRANEIKREKLQLEQELARIEIEKRKAAKELEEQAKEREHQRKIELQEAEMRAQTAQMERLKKEELAKEREHQREMERREAERKRVIAQTQKMEAMTRSEALRLQREAADKKAQEQYEKERRQEMALAQEEYILHRKQNYAFFSRALYVLIAITIFSTNYLHFFADFDKTFDYIFLGCIAYVFLDIVALVFLAMAFRYDGSEPDLDSDVLAPLAIGGLVVSLVLIVIDVHYVNSVVGDFIFDILEVFSAGLVLFACVFCIYKERIEKEVFFDKDHGKGYTIFFSMVFLGCLISCFC